MSRPRELLNLKRKFNKIRKIKFTGSMMKVDHAPTWPNFLRAEVLSLIVAMFVQAGALIWWGSKLDSRVTSLEAKMTAAAHQGEDIARIDERTKSIDESVARIERELDDKNAGARAR